MNNSVSAEHILIVDDEACVRDVIVFGLSRQGFVVHAAHDAKAAKLSIADLRPDLAIVDWALPGTSGLDLTRDIKRTPVLCELPIVMLTARAEENDRIAGFEAGVDDYVTKPFSVLELAARIRSILRRTQRKNPREIRAGDLLVDLESQRVSASDRTISLSPAEFQLLSFLMTHQERVHSRTELRDRVWGAHMQIEERSIDVRVLRLRRALKAFNCDALIQTVNGVGYRFSVRKA